MTKETVKELAQKVGTGYFSTEDDTNYYTVNIRTYTKVPLDKRPEEIHPDFVPITSWSNRDSNRVEEFQYAYMNTLIPELEIRMMPIQDSTYFEDKDSYSLVLMTVLGNHPLHLYPDFPYLLRNPSLEDLLKHYEILKPQLIEWKKGITNQE